MSAKKRAKPCSETDLDSRMNEILVEVADIDIRIKKFKERRTALVAKYEELKEVKMLKDSEAVSLEQDWATGDLFILYFLMNFNECSKNTFFFGKL